MYLDRQGLLELAAEQVEVIRSIRDAALRDSERLDTVIADLEAELWCATGSAKPDYCEIRSLVERIGELQARRRYALIEAVSLAADILRPRQVDRVLGRVIPGD